MNNLDYCFHTHTFRCGHAKGEDIEYVKEAIVSGIKYLGFSDHIMLPGYSQPGVRGDANLIEDYKSSINSLKKQFKKQIEIKVGFECEYFEGKFNSFYKDLLTTKEFDYLILGEHCFISNENKFVWYGLQVDYIEELNKYVESVVEAMKSNLFLYIAHADHFMIWYPKFDEHVEEACKRIAEASKQYNVPLELNLGSLRRDALRQGFEDLDCAYPKVSCVEAFKKYGAKFVIGYDAHGPLDFKISLKKDLPYVFSLIDKLDLDVLNKKQLWNIYNKKLKLLKK